jgi:signal transduction histidine kinase
MAMKPLFSQEGGDAAVELNHARFEWALDEGTLSSFGIRLASFWLAPSLLHMLEPLAREVGEDLFRMMVAHSSSRGTDEDYHTMVTILADRFEAGFAAWGRAVGGCGWGAFDMQMFDPEAKVARVVVTNPWELHMQRDMAPERQWGCPFLMGKIIGIFSRALGTNCWADEALDLDQPAVTFSVYASERTIVNELEGLRLAHMQARERELAAQVAAKTAELQRAQASLEAHSRELETRVEQRTQDLSHTLQELKQAQSTLVRSEKLATLGQIVAGVAHEINNPMGAISASAGNVQEALGLAIAWWKQSDPTSDDRESLLPLITHAMEPMEHLSFTEKRALRRTLRAQLPSDLEEGDDIAQALVDLGVHALTPTLESIVRHPRIFTLLDQARNIQTLMLSAHNINLAVQRASKIVFALKTYAHQDNSGRPTRVRLQDGLETVLTVYHSMLRQGLHVERRFERGLEPLLGFHDELNQVWTNLLHNAVQATGRPGTLVLALHGGPDEQVVEFHDSGPGVPAAMRERIFEPFFTTKPAGAGTGLGLDIARQFVTRHRGTIEVDDSPEGGALFRVRLPCLSESDFEAVGHPSKEDEP